MSTYTSIEQSKHLCEIGLDVNTSSIRDSSLSSPVWSAEALLSLWDDFTLTRDKDKNYELTLNVDIKLLPFVYPTLLEAAYEMVSFLVSHGHLKEHINFTLEYAKPYMCVAVPSKGEFQVGKCYKVRSYNNHLFDEQQIAQNLTDEELFRCFRPYYDEDWQDREIGLHAGKWYVCTETIVSEDDFIHKGIMRKCTNDNHFGAKRILPKDFGCFREWSILDAIEGDVVTWNNGTLRVIGIYKGMSKNEGMHNFFWYLFRHYSTEQLICGDKIAYNMDNLNVRPAEEDERSAILMAIPTEEYQRIYKTEPLNEL